MSISLAQRLAVDRIIAELGEPSEFDEQHGVAYVCYGDVTVGIRPDNYNYALSIPCNTHGARGYRSDFYESFDEMMASLKFAVPRGADEHHVGTSACCGQDPR